jgi:hypothetical protein
MNDLAIGVLSDEDMLTVAFSGKRVAIKAPLRLARTCKALQQAVFRAKIDVELRGTAVGLRYLKWKKRPASWRVVSFRITCENVDTVDMQRLGSEVTLTRLTLRNNMSVIDLTPLAALISLEYLNLSFSKVYDLTPLAALTSLEKLDLSFTRLIDLSPLAVLGNLKVLDLASAKTALPFGVLDTRPLDELVKKGLNVLDSLESLLYEGW